ncbi:MAG TPA: hypothetical protein VGJ35_00930 [Burkholderiaceae bacterium]
MKKVLHALLAALLLAAAAAGARPITPASDSEVIETLPLAGAQRSQLQRLRHAVAARPGDAALATQLARKLLEQARRDGEPRFAGQALAVLQRWANDPRDDGGSELQLVLADTEQHLHDFERATRRVQSLLQRDAGSPQGWLMLATLQRVQGRYAASDQACRMLARLGAALHANACLAENAALRGEAEGARRMLQQLLAANGDAATRAWLSTTLAELELRAGRPAAAEAAFRASLAAQPDAYAAIALADLLIAQHRPQAVGPLLASLPRSDSVLLRLAVAARDARSTQADALLHELRERLAELAQRGGASSPHAREQAMFALYADGDAARALQFARINVQAQREPIDVLLLTAAARASGQSETHNEGRALAREIGLHDQRLAS